MFEEGTAEKLLVMPPPPELGCDGVWCSCDETGFWLVWYWSW